MKIHFITLCLCCILLTACLPKIQARAPQSPYMQQALALTETGYKAMQNQHWRQATQLFQRAKVAAELADHTALVSSSWYNIGMAHVGAAQKEHALRAFRLANKHADAMGRMRICLAQQLLTKIRKQHCLALLQTNNTWPIDIYLSAARLAQQQHNNILAQNMYQHVLTQSQKDKRLLSYRAQAFLGLALLYERHEKTKASQAAQNALSLFHQLAQPRRNAHTLWLLYRLEKNHQKKQDFAQRACKIYVHLQDQQAMQRCQTTGVRP